MGASLTLTAYEVANSVNVANNTSQVYIKLDITTDNGTWSHDGTTDGAILLDGVQIANLKGAWVDMNTTTNLYTSTTPHTVTHNSDGTKTVAISCSFDMNTATRWIYASKNLTLTTIARKSTLSVGNGTLGTSLTFTITELATAHTHKIKYFCGSAEGYVLGDASTTSTALSTNWTPPNSLAAQNTTGKSLSVKYTVYTFNANGALIGENSYNRTLTIPTSLKPTCSVTVSDANGYASTYGGYIQGHSKLSVTVTGTPIQSSPIDKYSVSANGMTYSMASVTTGVISSATTPQTITATVTDKRGNTSAAATASITVLPYTSPAASLSAVRVNDSGKTYDQGAKIKVTFSTSVASLNSKNTKTVTLKYKKSTASSYTSVSSPTSPYTFAADTGSSYDVVVEVKDKLNNTTTKSTTVATAFALMNFKADGTGIGIGKVSETSNALELGIDILMGGNKITDLPTPTADTDAATKAYADSMKDKAFSFGTVYNKDYNDAPVGTWWSQPANGACTNYPEGATYGFLTTVSVNSNLKAQTYTQYATGITWFRAYVNSAWNDWKQFLPIDKIYPVNSVYISYSHTSPASLFGGTWHRMESRFLWGTPSTGTIGATGGEQTHALTTSELPAHSHNVYFTGSVSSGGTVDYLHAPDSTKIQPSAARNTVATSSTGSGTAHNNMPPYVNVAIWRRTA